MKKKLVLFTLILGLLLPVFGVAVSAERPTRDDWHETDRKAVEKIEKDGWTELSEELEKQNKNIKTAQDAIDAWQKAIDVRNGMNKTVKQAQEDYDVAAAAAEKAEDDVKDAKAAHSQAQKEYDEARALAENVDETVSEKKSAFELAANARKEAFAVRDADKDSADKLREETQQTINDYTGIAEKLPTATDEERVEYLAALTNNAKALGFKFDDSDLEADGKRPLQQLKAARNNPASQTYGDKQLLKNLDEAENALALSEANAQGAQDAYDVAKAELEEIKKAQADREAYIAEKKAARDAAEKAEKDAREVKIAADKAAEKAKNELDGARSALAGDDEDSAEAKLKEASNYVKNKIYSKRDPNRDWNIDYARELLKAQIKTRDDFVNSKKFQTTKAEYDKAVFEAENRPATVSDLKAVANSDGTITLSWKKVDADFVVVFYLGTDGSKKVTLAELSGDTTTYTHEEPVLNANNFYTVVAVDKISELKNGYYALTGYQTEEGIDEIGWAYAYAQVTHRPADVTGLRAVTDKDGYVTVSWEAAEGADYYRLFSLGTDGKSQKVLYEGPATSFQDEKAVATVGDDVVWNFYTVNAVRVMIDKDQTKTEFLNANTNPAYTYAWADGSLRGKEEPEVGELEAIENMTATTNADGTITVNWSEDPNAFYYIVVYISRTDANGENNVNVQTWKSVSGDTSATFDELAEGYHFFRVYGVNKIDGEYRQSPPADPNYTFAFTAGTEVAD